MANMETFYQGLMASEIVQSYVGIVNKMVWRKF